MEPNGYTSDVGRLTLIDAGWDDPACFRAADPIRRLRLGRGDAARGIPGARLRPEATLANLAALAARLPDALYGAGGFKDA